MRSLPAWAADRRGDGDGRRRYLIAAGTARYRNLPKTAWLPSVRGDVTRLVELFCGRLGYERALPELGEDPTSDSLRRELSAWLRDEARRDDDVVVIYYSGHGDSETGTHYLLAADSVEGDLVGTALATETIGKMVGESSRVRHLLVILDTCYAGQGALDLAAVARQVTASRAVSHRIGSGLWCVAATRPREEADEGVFVDALLEAVQHPRTGFQAPYIGLEGLVDAVNQTFQHRRLRQRSTLSVTDSTGLPPFVPNPTHDPTLPAGLDLESMQLLRQQDLITHWGPRARGVELDTQPGWYFAGRTQVLQELIGWLTDPAADRAPRALTGAPGSGKSAVLARLVTLSDPRIRQAAPSALAAATPGTIPPVGLVDVAIHAKNKTLTDVLADLTAATGINATAPAELIEALAARPGRLVVVVDALDEAVAPANLAQELLNPLAATASSDLRLLIGTRRHLLDQLDARAVVIDLDAPPWVGPDDLVDYITQVLLAEHEPTVRTPYRGQPDLARTVAHAVAARAHPSFLIARIAARSLLARGRVVEVTDAGWQERFPTSVGEAFDADLARYGPDAQRIRDLLVPLAWAEGAGLPWEHLWAPLARALTERLAYTDEDIRWLQEVAGAYVLERREHERSAYQLYHQAVTEHLRDDTRATYLQQRITDTLIGLTPTGPDGQPDWFAAHPYIRTHLATHAAAAGRLDSLLEDPRFLLAADPDRLLRASATVQSAAGAMLAAETFQAAVHQLRARPPGVAAAYLQLVARQRGANELAARIDQLGLAQPWSVRWAGWHPPSPHRIAGRHDGGIKAIALAALDGRPMVVSVGFDGLVRVWDLARGVPVGAPINPNAGVIYSMAVGELEGRPVLVTGSRNGNIGLWDLARGVSVGAPPNRHSGVRAVAVSTVKGHQVAITAGVDGAVRVLDLAQGVWIGQPMQPNVVLRLAAWLRLRRRTHASLRGVNAVAVGVLDGRSIAISAGHDGAVHIWDIARRLPLGPPLQRKLRLRLPRVRAIWVRIARWFGLRTRSLDDWKAIAVGEFDGRPVAVSGGDDGALRLWDLAGGVPVGGPLTGHTGAIRAVAVGTVKGRLVAVSGGDDATVRVWDLAEGTPLGAPLIGHEFAVRGVAVGMVEGRPVAVSGGEEGSVRVWDLTRSLPSDATDTDYPGALNAVAVATLEGRPAAITGGDDGTVRVWDLADGRSVGAPLTGHKSAVYSVAVGTVEGRPVAVTGGKDGMVRMWELARHVPVSRPQQLEPWLRLVYGLIDDPPHNHSGTVNAIAIGEMEGRPVAVSGGSSGPVRVWELTQGTPAGTLCIGRVGQVNAVATATVEGRLMAVTAGFDGSVRIWDLTRHIAISRPLQRRRRLLLRFIDLWRDSLDEFIDRIVRAVATGDVEGRPVAVSAGSDGLVRVWDLARRIPACPPLSGHLDWIRAVAVGELEGRAVTVSGSDDGTVRIWDLADGSHQTIELGSTVNALALGPDNTLVLAAPQGLMVLSSHFASGAASASTSRAGRPPITLRT